jgi:hypothetical protein
VATAPTGLGAEEQEDKTTAKAKSKGGGDAPVLEKFVPGAVTFDLGQVPGLQTADKGARTVWQYSRPGFIKQTVLIFGHRD